MKELYWPEFETALKQKVRGHIAQSPELLCEYRRRKVTASFQELLTRLGYGLGILIFGLSVLTIFSIFSSGYNDHRFLPGSFLSVVTTCCSLAWAFCFRKHPQKSPALPVFCTLPVPNTVAFDFICRTASLPKIVLFSVFSAAILGGIWGVKEAHPIIDSVHYPFTYSVDPFIQILVGLGFAGLLTMVTQGCTIWLIHNWTTFFSKGLLLIFLPWTTFIVGMQAFLYTRRLSLPLQDIPGFFTLIFPAEWVCFAFYHGVLTPDTRCLFTLIPAFLLIAESSRRFHQLRASFSLEEQELQLPSQLFNPPSQPQSLPEFANPSAIGSQPSSVLDSDLMAAQVRRTLFTPGFDLAKQGWVERLSARYLSQSEQQVLEFMAGGTKINDWTKLWKLGLACATATSLGLLCSPLAFEFWKYLTQNIPGKFAILFILLAMGVILGFLSIVLFAVASIFLFCCSPAAGYALSGFRLYRTSEKTIPIYAVYPIGFWPMIRIQWKLSLIRLILSFPALVVLGIGINSVFNLSSGIGIELAVKMVCVLMLILCLGMADGFSRGTSCGFASLFETIHGIGILLSGCGITRLLYLIAAGSTWEFATVWLIFMGLMFLWLLAFGKLYNHGKVDLLRKAA